MSVPLKRFAAAPLTVELQRGPSEPVEHFAFERSPVRVGRGIANELSIDQPFVSHCHGVLQFGDDGVEFVDLGSTNGSYLDGVRLESHRCTPLPSAATLGIGPLRMRVRLDSRRSGLQAVAHEHGRQQLAHEDGAQAEQLAALIERFAQSFLDLGHAQRAWLRELGVDTPAPRGLDGLGDPLALVGYLLAPEHRSARLAELSAACADLLHHQDAVLHAIGAAGRDLLDELAPDALAPRMSGPLTWLARLFGRDPRWTAFERRHHALLDDGVRANITFGANFRRAYEGARARSQDGGNARAALAWSRRARS